MEADSETAREHERSPVVIDGAPCPREKVVSILGACLDALPAEVRETRRFVLGRMRGFTFGLIKHRFTPPEVFLAGAGERQAQLSRDSQGPRACLNALERLYGSYEARCEETRRELHLSETKLRDFEDRLGAAFPHEHYIRELSSLRDELKAALSAREQEGTDPKTRPAGELSELIRTLKDSHIIETEPVKRSGTPKAERPVTARPRKQAEIEPDGGLAPELVEGPPATEAMVRSDERPVPAPVASEPARSNRREVQRRRYQKWLF